MRIKKDNDMPCERFIHEGLCNFRQAFSRKRTWLMFTVVVMSFIACWHMDGVTSWCRTWGWFAHGYDQLLHFFRAVSFSVEQLEFCWWNFVAKQGLRLESNGRWVLVADHTLWAKDARKSPGVVNLHQDSETQSKPSYFRGHCWGGLGLLVGKLEECFCLPLSLRLHQGENDLGKKQDEDKKQDEGKKQDEDKKEVLGKKIMSMALNFALHTGKPCVVILDAFFGSNTVFEAARSFYSLDIKAAWVEVITRAKSNYVAFESPSPKIPGKRGRPAKYGNKIKLYSLFEQHPECFQTLQCDVYGQLEDIKIYCTNLLWKPIKEQIRFVFAQTSRGRIVLMCSDLGQDPLMAIRLYCARTRIEIVFDVLKNVMGAFSYRFWTKAMTPRSRKPQKNKNKLTPELTVQAKFTIQSCWKAYEKFMLCACVATGLMQLCALKFPQQILKNHRLFMRTKSRSIPSERTVKAVLAPRLIAIFLNVPSKADFMEILVQKIWKKTYHEEKNAQGPPGNKYQNAA